MIKKENKNKFTKKHFNYIKNRLDYLRLIERILRKKSKKEKNIEISELADCLADIREDIYSEIISAKQGGLKDLYD